MLGSNVDLDRARETITAIPPRRLRLDELLRELGADDGVDAAGVDAAGVDAAGVDGSVVGAAGLPRVPNAAARNNAEPQSRRELEDPRTGSAESASPSSERFPDGSNGMTGERLARVGVRPTSLTVGELVDKASEAGFGFLIGILTLIAIPFFGLSTPFGLAIALVGAQLMIGRTKPWLPQRARRRALRMAMLDRVLGILARRTRWLARSTKRRWEILIHPRIVGLGVVLLALALALPLPIPGSNLVFLIPLFVYAIGLLERDGLWIALGHLCVLVHAVLFVVFSKTIVMVLEQIASWFS
jgi:hypothetical protein